MQGKEFEGISSYEDCLPIVHEKLKGRMKWVWGHDLESDYVEAREKAGLGPLKTADDFVRLPKTNGKMNQRGVSVTEVEA